MENEGFQFIIENPQQAQGHKKRPRLVTSCDNCRLKKIKCILPSPDSKCEACKAAKIGCKFRDRERYFAERSRAISGDQNPKGNPSSTPRSPTESAESAESTPAPELLRQSSSRTSMHPYQSGSAVTSPSPGPSSNPHGSSSQRPSHSPSTSTTAPFYSQDTRYEQPKYRPLETVPSRLYSHSDTPGGRHGDLSRHSSTTPSSAPYPQERYQRVPPESTNFPVRYQQPAGQSPASPISPMSPTASPAPHTVAGHFAGSTPSSASSSHFPNPPALLPREGYHNTLPPPPITSVRLFDVDHTLFPHAALMPGFIDGFFDNMGRDCPFITRDEISSMFYGGRLTALLANGIAALAGRYTQVPGLVLKGAQSVADTYGDNAKAILRTARTSTNETVQGALLIAWLEYKSNRMPGFRKYCQLAMDMAVEAGISSEERIAQNPDPSARAQLRTTWSALTHLHRAADSGQP